MSDQVKDKVGQIRDDERELLASLQSKDPEQKHSALLQIVVSMSRAMDAFGSQWSEFIADHGNTCLDLKNIAVTLADLSRRIGALEEAMRGGGDKTALDKVLYTFGRLGWPSACVLIAAMAVILVRPQILEVLPWVK